MKYKIYPPIGIARLGNHDQFFIGPEIPGAGAHEIAADGSEHPIRSYKDATRKRIKKQGARFHLFQSENGTDFRPAILPSGATVTWTVHLVNKKSAVVRPARPPIAVPQRPLPLQTNPQGLLLDGGIKNISGQNATGDKFVDRFEANSADGPYGVNVELGQLRTDTRGQLIVVGGTGFSSAPPNTPLGASYYRNPGWHDDVADGPVLAEIRLSDGTVYRADGGAWVVVGPPDYAPAIHGVVTLFDVLREVGMNAPDALPDLAQLYFDRDIRPIIERTRRLKWVHDDTTWSDPNLDSPDLRNPSAAFQNLRRDARKVVLKIQQILEGHEDPNGPPFRLRGWQRTILQRWEDGDFDGTIMPSETTLTAEGLTRAALDGAVGQGFCPGIEAGIIVLDPTLYRTPFEFRLNHDALSPGDLTALMAQPWQADFLKCNTAWWPTQRPDQAPQADGTFEKWFRGVPGQHHGMVRDSSRLGFIVQQGHDEVFVEVERDDTLP